MFSASVPFPDTLPLGLSESSQSELEAVIAELTFALTAASISVR